MTVGPGSTLTHLESRKSGERGCVEKGKEEARTSDRRLRVSHSAAVQEHAVPGDQPCGLTAQAAGRAQGREGLSWLHLCWECAVFVPNSGLNLIPWCQGHLGATVLGHLQGWSG